MPQPPRPADDPHLLHRRCVSRNRGELGRRRKKRRNFMETQRKLHQVLHARPARIELDALPQSALRLPRDHGVANSRHPQPLPDEERRRRGGHTIAVQTGHTKRNGKGYDEWECSYTQNLASDFAIVRFSASTATNGRCARPTYPARGGAGWGVAEEIAYTLNTTDRHFINQPKGIKLK